MGTHASDLPAHYEAAREREGRLLPDDVVRGLPRSGMFTPHVQEWLIRERSARELERAIGESPQCILEIGCGNGWLSARFAKHGHTVTGLDIGALELAQAVRVFGQERMVWIEGDPWSSALGAGSFDRIVFAASLQYFPALPALFQRCRDLLREHGSIHVVDTVFYANENDRGAAAERSRLHYTHLGVPGMAGHYQHHTWAELRDAARPGRLSVRPAAPRWQRALGFGSPFPAVHIRV